MFRLHEQCDVCSSMQCNILSNLISTVQVHNALLRYFFVSSLHTHFAMCIWHFFEFWGKKKKFVNAVTH